MFMHIPIRFWLSVARYDIREEFFCRKAELEAVYAKYIRLKTITFEEIFQNRKPMPKGD